MSSYITIILIGLCCFLFFMFTFLQKLRPILYLSLKIQYIYICGCNVLTCFRMHKVCILLPNRKGFVGGQSKNCSKKKNQSTRKYRELFFFPHL